MTTNSNHPRPLPAVRADAGQHQRDLEAAAWWKPSALARRWGVSKTTVLAIPRTELPYMEVGRGLKVHHRRYNPVDVAAYEARATGREEAA